jgi:hypothetical protein
LFQYALTSANEFRTVGILDEHCHESFKSIAFVMDGDVCFIVIRRDILEEGCDCIPERLRGRDVLAAIIKDARVLGYHYDTLEISIKWGK